MVRIVTDSVSDIPPELVAELNISIVPLNVRFGTQVYRDGIDLAPKDFYQKLTDTKIAPTTSVPPPAAFADVYNTLAEETDEILVITVTSKLSATYEVAVQSIGLVNKKCRVEVVDSQCAVMAEGFLAIIAARAAQVGAGLDEVLSIVNQNMSRVEMRAAFDTLKYLERGGRIGKAQAFLGSMLSVNPIIGVKDGEVFPFGRERSRSKAIDYLYNFAISFSQVEELAVEYADSLDEADMLINRLSSKFPSTPIHLSRASPVIGAHTGPGLIIVTVLGDRA